MNQRIATWSPALSYASGTASSCLSMPQGGPTSGLQPTLGTTLTTNLPVILFDLLNTDKENNNDND